MTNWLTTTEAAELSGYHPERIRELIREGKVQAQKKGNAWWVDQASLQAYMHTVQKTIDRRHGPKGSRT